MTTQASLDELNRRLNEVSKVGCSRYYITNFLRNNSLTQSSVSVNTDDFILIKIKLNTKLYTERQRSTANESI